MNLNETLQNLRVSYQASKLDILECHPDPVLQFNKWLNEAISSQCDEPNAFVLSSTLEDQPRARVVLLKGIDEGEFIFYSNYLSSKGAEIEKNKKVAMTFCWLPLQRQVRIEGLARKVSEKISDDYFQKRPRGSQLGAIASPQSQKVKDRHTLEQMFKDTDQKYNDSEIIPRPPHWGGYAIKPSLVEFWQGRTNRMHDRVCFQRSSSGWDVFRLAP